LHLLLPALLLLLYSNPDLLLDGGYPTVLKGMTIRKTFLFIPFIAYLLTLISGEVYFFLISYFMLNKIFINITGVVSKIIIISW